MYLFWNSYNPVPDTPGGSSVFLFGNFGSEIQIGDQQVLGQNWEKDLHGLKKRHC